MNNYDGKVKLIRLPDVQLLTGMARSTIYERMAQGTFPRPLKLSIRHVAWKEQNIVNWIESLPCSFGAAWTGPLKKTDAHINKFNTKT